ncbi:putative MULE transposase domain-containing protein 3 [Homarus americanus]|uniref:Putative MULE transposase domain-containing protein 3 n=1 Tax=Homarus americanus TaxID=6706 RepID=A0A8J5N5X8_HOMAM|nr:putative MULE transposase domain-containing protein 3 [Homarus americanus]
MFATEEGLCHLAGSDTWYMDGTFTCAPFLFEQLYIIRAPLGESALSCVYAFLSRKSQEIYEEMLTAVHDKGEELGFYMDVTTTITDFEQAALNAINNMLGPHVNAKAYLVDHFDENYVTGTYRRIGQTRQYPVPVTMRVRRIPPLFPPEKWNVNLATIDNEYRTNNLCESWNRGFQQLVGYSHPTIWTAIEFIRKDAAIVSLTLTLGARGQPLHKRETGNQRPYKKRLGKSMC